jgi:hypothetical protein
VPEDLMGHDECLNDRAAGLDARAGILAEKAVVKVVFPREGLPG